MDTVRSLAQQYFGQLAPHPQKNRKLQTEPPILGKKQIQIHAAAQVPALMMGYTVPSAKTVTENVVKTDSMDPYALELIAGILDAGESSRFNERLIRGDRIASTLAVQYNMYSRYQTQLTFYGTPNQTHTVDDLRQGILAELKRLQIEPISETELSRVKTQIIAQKTFERDSVFSQAMEMGLLETIGLGWQAAEYYVERINSVTPEHIQKAATHYLKENNLTEALLIPSESANKSGNKA
jgi:zinc protease